MIWKAQNKTGGEMRVLGILLLLTGNMSFAQQTPDASKCQSFVSNVLERYGLLSPDIERASAPEFLHQVRPEFILETPPIEVNKQAPYKAKPYALQFMGGVVKSGNYRLSITEVEIKSRISSASSRVIEVIPLVHRVHDFYFSADCEFEAYFLGQPPSKSQDGFLVRANSQCEFDEPHKEEGSLTADVVPFMDETELDETDAAILLLVDETSHFGGLDQSTNDYVSVDYPYYYRELCALAQNGK